ncbi:MAG: hypothetical protein Q8Q12_21635 [bacterium]|nr:hypothetical protein [bacterium]
MTNNQSKKTGPVSLWAMASAVTAMVSMAITADVVGESLTETEKAYREMQNILKRMGERVKGGRGGGRREGREGRPRRENSA